jgi:thymidylate synthase (FAD)
MKLIKPYYEIISPIKGDDILKTLEKVARTCYKSEDKITEDSAEKMIKILLSKKHEAMIEFFDIIVKFVCDRGVSHEIVRHRLASYAQESTRYCNYSKDKFENQITFIIPSWCNIYESQWTHEQAISSNDLNGEINSLLWLQQMSWSEKVYNKLIKEGWQAQQARSVLPNSLKTEINVKMNLREWRHFFKLRCAQAAHPQMRELAIPLLNEFKEKIPIIFDDITY